MPEALTVLAIATALGAGVVAGVFFAFSNFAMAGLGLIPAPEGIRAMQSINITVINPLFMTALFGTGLASLVVAGMAIADWDAGTSPLLVAAGLLYVVGCDGVTMAMNVPRNIELDRADADSAAGEEVWRHYLREWTFWNSVRTVASLAACGLMVVAVAV